MTKNPPCVPNIDNSNNKKIVSSVATITITQPLVAAGEIQQEIQDGQQQDYSHKGENCHSKNKIEKSDNEHLKPDPKAKIKDELEKSGREQLILLKENKQNVIDFLLENKDSIRVKDLKIYEPVYKCIEKKGIAIFVTAYLILFV